MDITHSSADDEFTVPTSRGTVALLRACFSQYPFTERSSGLEPFVSVQLDGDWYPFDPDGLCDLADAMARSADWIRSVADRFNNLTSAGRQTP